MKGTCQFSFSKNCYGVVYSSVVNFARDIRNSKFSTHILNNQKVKIHNLSQYKMINLIYSYKKQ